MLRCTAFEWMQVLSDDEKRSIYDRFGEAGLKGAGQGAGPVRVGSMGGGSYYHHTMKTANAVEGCLAKTSMSQKM